MKRTHNSLDSEKSRINDFPVHPSSIKRPIPQKYLFCAKTGIFSFVYFFFDDGKMDINTKDKTNGHTLLYYAVKNGNFEVVIKLLSLGADPNFQSDLYDSNYSPALLAETNYDIDLIGLLKDYENAPEDSLLTYFF
jgi:hypothetical protein